MIDHETINIALNNALWGTGLMVWIGLGWVLLMIVTGRLTLGVNSVVSHEGGCLCRKCSAIRELKK